jgi:hypothetical protein
MLLLQLEFIFFLLVFFVFSHLIRHAVSLSYSFSMRSALKRGKALSPLLLNFRLECAIEKVQRTLNALKSNARISFQPTLVALIKRNINIMNTNRCIRDS